MFPVLFRIGDAALFTYPVLFSLAYFVGLGLWIREARPYGIPAEKLVNLSLWAILWGLLGARALYLFTQWPALLSGELKVWALWEGGLVFFGGFLSALAYLSWALPRHGIPRALGFDLAAPAIACAHAVGRLGCFANGCCYGKVCSFPWGVRYHNPISIARPLETPLHPTQLYEVLTLLGIAWWLMKNNRRAPEKRRFASRFAYLALYGVARFMIEDLRGDPERGQWGLFSTSQWVSVGVVFTAITLDFIGRRYHKLPHES